MAKFHGLDTVLKCCLAFVLFMVSGGWAEAQNALFSYLVSAGMDKHP